MKKKVTRAEYARMRGISKPAVTQAVKSGKIILGDDGLIDVAQADFARSGNQSNHPDDKKPVSSDVTLPGGANYATVRAANEALKAQRSKVALEKEKIELEKTKGMLVERALVKRAMFEFGQQERQSWLGWPHRVAPEMAAELGVPGQLMLSVLDKFVRNNLNELADVHIELRA